MFVGVNGQYLNTAASLGQVEQVRALLKLESIREDIDWQRPDGCTSLYLAASWESPEHFEVCKLLIDHGANVDLSNEIGQTPLYVAASWGHARIVALLLENGARKDEAMRQGRTPLYIAAYARPHINAPLDNLGRRYINYDGNAKRYMQVYARTYVANIMETGEYQEFFPEIENDYQQLLREFSLDDIIPDEVMDVVVPYNHFATVSELVRAGAALNLRDNIGETALTKAQWANNTAIMHYLREHGATR